MCDFIYSIFEHGYYSVPFTITANDIADAHDQALKIFKAHILDSTYESMKLKLVFIGTFDKYSGQFTNSKNEHNVIASYRSFIER